ncbi:MAG: hypothetical protein ABIS13_08285 [Nitrosospira sp.]
MGISPQVLCANNPLRKQLRNRHRNERSGYNADTRRQVRVVDHLTLLEAASAAFGRLWLLGANQAMAMSGINRRGLPI